MATTQPDDRDPSDSPRHWMDAQAKRALPDQIRINLSLQALGLSSNRTRSSARTPYVVELRLLH